MSCITLCGCANPIGTLFKPKKKQLFVDCVINDYYFREGTDKAITEGTYTVPNSGWYIGYISSHGADISATMIYYPQGTNVICNYYKAGTQIKYQLGSNSKVQNVTGEWIEAGIVPNLNEGEQVFKAKVVFQYLGEISEPTLILTDAGFREGTQPFYKFLQNTKFADTPRVQEPQLSDIVYNATGNNTFSFYSVTEFTVPETGTYLIGSAGDDYANAFIDGKPALWLAKDNPNRSLLVSNKDAHSAYNTLLTNEVHLTAGKHTLVFWNCSPICCNISGIVAVKNPRTNEVYAYDTKYKYVRSPINCLGEVSATKFRFKADNSYPQSTTTTNSNNNVTPVSPTPAPEVIT